MSGPGTVQPDPRLKDVAADMAKARGTPNAKPVTIEDCKRTLATLKEHTNVVDRATHAQQYEFLIGLAERALSSLRSFDTKLADHLEGKRP